MGEMGMGLPEWLTELSWMFIIAAVLSAGAILHDIHGRGNRQPDRVMEVVWPLSALYLGPLALPIYRRFGQSTDGSLTASAVRCGLPCGVSCGLAHVIGVPIVVVAGLTIAGLDMWAMVVLIAVLATAGIFLFESAAFASKTRRPAGRRGLRDAAAIALVTAVAFDAGMLGWMLVLHFSENMPAASDVRFTFLMQVGLIIGSVTAYPAMRLLAARQTKTVW